jgi:hypothetical protein
MIPRIGRQVAATFLLRVLGPTSCQLVAAHAVRRYVIATSWQLVGRG